MHIVLTWIIAARMFLFLAYVRNKVATKEVINLE